LQLIKVLCIIRVRLKQRRKRKQNKGAK